MIDDFSRGYEAAKRHYRDDPRAALIRIDWAQAALRDAIPNIPAAHPLARFLAEVDAALDAGLCDTRGRR